MSSLDKSWSKAAVRCPRHEHAGSRVRFDGHYGVPGHRRQLYKCIPVDGERPHRFSENLPRQESWAEACEACERDELVAPRRVRTFVEADVALASLAGLGPGLLPRKVLREAMRTLSVDRNALVQLSTMPGHAVMPSKRTRDPACSCLGHLTAALLQLLSSDDISPVTVGATSDRTHLAEHSQRQNALRDALGGPRLAAASSSVLAPRYRSIGRRPLIWREFSQTVELGSAPSVPGILAVPRDVLTSGLALGSVPGHVDHGRQSKGDARADRQDEERALCGSTRHGRSQGQAHRQAEAVDGRGVQRCLVSLCRLDQFGWIKLRVSTC